MALIHDSIPDSEICKKATQLVTEVSPTSLCNHCIRTFLFGDLLGIRDGLKCDRELLYLGAIMHDLGLTERFDAEQRFEVNGADAARAFVLEHGLSDEKAEIVWDAIALHTSIGIAIRKQPEIALVHLGATADLLGMRISDITPETVEQILDVYPRLGFNQQITQLMVSQVKRKPQTATFTWLAEVGRCCIHGFVSPNWNDMLNSSPFAE
ncbi:HD domain-containing protein [Microcoleus sp. FACHB-SPT15]|uniref:HD domain-containing protein n=1 Tax=Microcoleus sp. FACHB-SPT15 TaxID=2692830 RepID=UPI0017822C4B|nr:HD domain-containing protein [Microcoleus sp. FACHB-SPT15]MBD1806627.1 HD domain-containing protein [Microcoleus sp. FACHB-SPT15]